VTSIATHLSIGYRGLGNIQGRGSPHGALLMRFLLTLDSDQIDNMDTDSIEDTLESCLEVAGISGNVIGPGTNLGHDDWKLSDPSPCPECGSTGIRSNIACGEQETINIQEDSRNFREFLDYDRENPQVLSVICVDCSTTLYLHPAARLLCARRQ